MTLQPEMDMDFTIDDAVTTPFTFSFVLVWGNGLLTSID